MNDSSKYIKFTFLLYVHLSIASSKIQDLLWNIFLNWKTYGKRWIHIVLYLLVHMFIDSYFSSLQLAQDYRLKDHTIQFLTRLNESFLCCENSVFTHGSLTLYQSYLVTCFKEERNHKNVIPVYDTYILINVAQRLNFKSKGAS